MKGLPVDCPPGEAEAPRGVYYVLARRTAKLGESLTSDDWTLPKDKFRGELVGRAEVCEAWAYSIFGAAETLRRT